MNKSEIFSLVTGTIGLIVDLIALATFLGTDRTAGGAANAWRTWSVILLVYSWFLVSWFLARQYRRRRGLQGKHQDRRNYVKSIATSVSATGVLLLPVAMMIIHPLLMGWEGWEGDPIEKSFILVAIAAGALGFIGYAMFFAIGGLVPIIYDDEQELF